MFQLLVVFVVIEWYDWDTVIYLKAKRICCVIYENYILEVSIGKYPQVFYVHSLGGLDTVFSEKFMVDQLILRV